MCVIERRELGVQAREMVDERAAGAFARNLNDQHRIRASGSRIVSISPRRGTRSSTALCPLDTFHRTTNYFTFAECPNLDRKRGRVLAPWEQRSDELSAVELGECLPQLFALDVEMGKDAREPSLTLVG